MTLEDVKRRSRLFDSREGWLAARRKGVGSSDASVIVGASQYSGVLELYADKIGLSEEKTAPHKEWGHNLERVIAQAWSEETGRPISGWREHTITQSEKYPWQIATLDEVCPEADGKDGPGVVEIKNSFSLRAREWQEELPLYVLAQVAHQLAVTGFKWASVGVLIGGNDFKWIDQDRDDEMEQLIESLTKIEAEFWGCVQRREPTALSDNPDSDRLGLGLLFPKEEPGRRIELNGEYRAIAATWDAAKRERSNWETTALTLGNKLRMAMGDAEVCEWDDDARLTFKTQKNGVRVLRGKGL